MLHLNISEAGMLPEQPRSQTFRQFSISTIKLKSLAKLSKESRLRTINEKGMTQIRLCHEGKKKKKKKHLMTLDQVSYTAISLHCSYFSYKSESTYCQLQ